MFYIVDFAIDCAYRYYPLAGAILQIAPVKQGRINRDSDYFKVLEAPVKFRFVLVLLVKSRLVGVNVWPDLLGVTRYVAPDWKPDLVQLPFESVFTDDGIIPVPETLLKVIFTPEIAVPLLVVTRPEALKVVGVGDGDGDGAAVGDATTVGFAVGVVERGVHAVFTL